jgi:hypothetical protein
MRSVRWIKALQKGGELRSGLDSAHHEDLANVGRRPFSLSERLPDLVRNRAVRKTGIAVCLVGKPILFQIF